MIRSDFHMHTYYCDGKDSPEEMVKSAIEKGFTTIGFSGHSYAPYDMDCCMDLKQTAEYRRKINALKDKYSGKIKIYCGVEQDIFAPLPVKPFDYSIGSVHYLKTGCGYTSVDYTPQVLANMRDQYFGGDIYALAEEYFKLVSDVAEKTGCDIIGHFDLVSKFNENEEFFDPKDPRYIKAYQSAADRLLTYGIPFEINTGAISRGWRSGPYPSMDIIKYIASKGGRFVLSSDAHSKENIGYIFRETEELLAKEGVEVEIFVPGCK
ncbi:MAG: histidinol-phosphatase [Firmicutes bacterium]|nr:histidinol-phosphatase [Bacillota bacterium]